MDFSYKKKKIIIIVRSDASMKPVASLIRLVSSKAKGLPSSWHCRVPFKTTPLAGLGIVLGGGRSLCSVFGWVFEY